MVEKNSIDFKVKRKDYRLEALSVCYIVFLISQEKRDQDSGKGVSGTGGL